MPDRFDLTQRARQAIEQNTQCMRMVANLQRRRRTAYSLPHHLKACDAPNALHGALEQRRPSCQSAPRLFDHFHDHPRGRVHELLFFSAIGALFLLGAWIGYKKDALSEPIAWLIALVGACFVGFSVLPQKKRAPGPPPPKGKRGEQAAIRKANKAQKRGPPPPIH